MHSTLIVLVTIVLFILAYAWYGRKLERLWHIDPKRATPAFTKYDSVDYIPAQNWLVLFGHHFSSIAGAGPIIGPVIACLLWGWLPALLWVLLGTIFIGGVLDFGSLITSVREHGSSVADIAMHVVSRRAKLLFAFFVWLALILVVAVFAYLCADTFVKEPKIIAPSLGLIPVAMIVGFLMYRVRANSILTTIFGLVCLVGLMIAGNVWSVQLSQTVWIVILLGYCFFASVLPVNILLQPRDYLSSFLLFFGLGVGYLGLLVSPKIMTMPAISHWSSMQGNLWPMLFVTVACGAVSGFHALIASGTTSKQIASERHVKRIGFGGMVLEGVVAVLAIVATAILFASGDNLQEAMQTMGPIGIYGKGYGVITDRLLSGQGSFIAIIILNAFILTTLDTAVRIARYLTEELFRFKNRYLSTMVIVGVSAFLALSGQWQRLWPIFGASNQLVAALALFVLSCWLLAKGKTVHVTIWPACFMLVTTMAALVWQAVHYVRQQQHLLLVIDVVLLLLAVFIVFEVARVLRNRRIQHA
ncbi:MAG: carbon starvation protein A [Candidatus Omnitrophica bacterium]|nr:carbon starvation protein A [Candidatus Omnitrophota bacterium]